MHLKWIALSLVVVTSLLGCKPSSSKKTLLDNQKENIALDGYWIEVPYYSKDSLKKLQLQLEDMKTTGSQSKELEEDVIAQTNLHKALDGEASPDVQASLLKTASRYIRAWGDEILWVNSSMELRKEYQTDSSNIIQFKNGHFISYKTIDFEIKKEMRLCE